MKKQRFSYAFFLIVSLAFFIYYPGYLSHLLFVFTIILPIFSLVSVLPAYFSLDFDLNFKADASAKNEKIPFVLTIHNSSYFPCSQIHLTLDYKNVLDNASENKTFAFKKGIGPLETTVINSNLYSQYCGKIKLSLKKAKVCDPLRLFALPVRDKALSEVKADVWVMPYIREFNCEVFPGSYLNVDHNTYALWKAGHDPSEIFQLRDYRAGDRLQKVHWKLSQRFDTLTVKDFSLPEDYFVNFLISFEKHSSIEAIDSMLEAFASIAADFLEQPVPFTVTWLEEPFLKTETVTEPEIFVSVLYHLLEMKPSKNSETLKLFIGNEQRHIGGHLIYIMDGIGDASARDTETAALLLGIIQKSQYRSTTVFLAGHNPALVKKLESAGCLVYALEESFEKKGRRPGYYEKAD